MKNILVLGGTRFFGEKAVKILLEEGHSVTIGTRGKSSHPFGNKVNHIIVDRTDANHPGWDEIGKTHWDAVFDNICYTKEDAELAIDKFIGKMDYYLLTSSLAVYEGTKEGFKESDFNPYMYQIDSSKEVTYAEGKRQAEAVFAQKSGFQLGILRLPIVLDIDDYTNRLRSYIEKIKNNEKILLDNPHAKISFIEGRDAARVIVWMLTEEKKGPYNASSVDQLSLSDFVNMLEKEIGKEADVDFYVQDEEVSPYSLANDYYLTVSKVVEDVLVHPTLDSWLRDLIQEMSILIEKE